MLSLNLDFSLKINTAPRSPEPVWAEISQGFRVIGKTLRESVFRGSFLGDDGFGSTEVTGCQLCVALSGVRVYGDPAQDFIFSDAVKNNRGAARKTDFLLLCPDGSAVSGKVALARITEGGGPSSAPDRVSVELHFNGKPAFIAEYVI